MFKEIWGEIPQTPEAADWVQKVMDSSIMTAKEVQTKWGLSQSTVSRLYTKFNWSFAFKKGNQILFLSEYAVPWFESYNAEQNINRSNETLAPGEPKRKKPGRPKKVKGEYEYTLWGSVYKTTNEPRAEMLNWKGYVAAQYPQFYEGGDFKKVIGELIKDQPPELKNALKEIDHVFRKIIAERAK